MASFNRVVLLGNITRDVELRYISSGKAVTDVGMAINDRRKSESGEWIEDTTFVDVTLWGRAAEVASEYASKGSPVLIEGHLKLDSWEKDGKKHSKLKVVGEKLQLLGSGKGKPAAEEPAWDGMERKPAARTAQQKAVAAGQGGAEDDIPF